MSGRSPQAKKTSKSKRHGEDTGGSSQKKYKADATRKPASTLTTEHRELRRSDRTGAGVGGHLQQLEWVSLAIEGPQHVSRPTTAFSDGTASNPVAPTNSGRTRKKVFFLLSLVCN